MSLFKKLFYALIFLSVVQLSLPTLDTDQTVQAQTLKVLAGNTLYGAATGAALATGTMAVKDDFQNLKPLRFGIGMGTLAGLGAGVYDLSQTQNGQQLYVSGSFNETNSTALIVLLDTFYGAATGVIVGSAITLMTGDAIIDGIRYGSGIGAWGGFAFGMVDALYLSQRSPGLAHHLTPDQHSISGLLSFDSNHNWQVGVINPGVHKYTELTGTDLRIAYTPSVELVNFRLDLK